MAERNKLKGLEATIAQLYDSFAEYRQGNMNLSKRLKNISNSEIYQYASDVINIAEVDEYLHYLPRILECATESQWQLGDIFQNIGICLHFGTVSSEQISTLREFLLEWWRIQIQSPCTITTISPIAEFLIDLNRGFDDLEWLLEVWTAENSDNAFANLSGMIYTAVMHKALFSEELSRQITRWLSCESTRSWIAFGMQQYSGQPWCSELVENLSYIS